MRHRICRATGFRNYTRLPNEVLHIGSVQHPAVSSHHSGRDCHHNFSCITRYMSALAYGLAIMFNVCIGISMLWKHTIFVSNFCHCTMSDVNTVSFNCSIFEICKLVLMRFNTSSNRNFFCVMPIFSIPASP